MNKKQYVIVHVGSHLYDLSIVNNTSYSTLEDAIDIVVLDFRIDNVGCYDQSDIDDMRKHFETEGQRPYLCISGDAYMICSIEPKGE